MGARAGSPMARSRGLRWHARGDADCAAVIPRAPQPLILVNDCIHGSVSVVLAESFTVMVGDPSNGT